MRRLVLCLLASMLAQGTAHAALTTCPNRVPAAINAATAAGLACQEKIAKEGTKFLKLKMAVLAACKLKGPAGACPTVKDSDKITLAAQKADAKIAEACGADTAQAGLSTSYNTLTDTAPITSCMLSQLNVVGEQVVWNAIGVTTEDWLNQNKTRDVCMKELAVRGRVFAAKALQNASACIKKAMKDGVAGDLVPLCVGSFSGGAFVPPTDSKTATKQAKLISVMEEKVALKCSDPAAKIPTIFGCAGSNTVADLQQCLGCQGFTSAFDALEAEYSERGKFVANGVGALQAAVTAAVDGDKLLIGSGTYAEEVLVTQNDLSIVGCGGATDARPLIVPPAPEVTGRGIRANAVSNIVLQSLFVKGQDNDGLAVTNSNGATFRDIIGDGDNGSGPTSAYSVFPRTCNNVVVELCKAKNCNDAPVYVGQSSTVLVRWNDVRQSVAAIEIENCGNAQVYNNYSAQNTAGMLVFKDGSLPVQLAECHHVHHNLLENNNRFNDGSGTVASVPDGTGLLVISADSTPYHHNISRGNNSVGFALTDDAFGGLPVAPEQNTEDNFIYDNWVTGNGGFPDSTPPNALPLPGADFLAVAFVALPPLGNCQSGNIYDSENGLLTLPTCTLPPPAFPGCPAPPVP